MKPWKCFWGAMLLCLLLLASCGEPNEVRTALNTADSLLADGQPDSAYSLLSSLPQPIKAKMPTKSLMRYELLKARAQNSAYIPFTSDSTMLRVADYYDRHGNANEQMTANYVLGCAYYDMGEAPLALRYFHEACDRADTTAADCDWKTLSRVHGQMARLFLDQNAPENAVDELDNAIQCTFQSKEQFIALAYEEQKANAYQELYMEDSVLNVRERVSRKYAQLGNKRFAALVLAPVIDILIAKGDTKKAIAYALQYEKEAGVFDENGNIDVGREVYYYLRGLIYLSVNKNDSAEYMFRKLLANAKTANHIESGSKGLLMLYQHTYNPDSISKYARLFCDYNDSTYREKATEIYQQTQALYKYKRQQETNARLTEDIDKKNLILSISFSMFILLFLSSYIFVLRYKKKKNDALRATEILIEKYENLQQSKTELEALMAQKDREIQNRDDIWARIEETYTLIKKSEEEISNYQTAKIDNRLLDIPIVAKFRQILIKHETEPSIEDWQEIKNIFNQELPNFIPFLRSKHLNLTEQELRVCMLVRLHFPPKDIACLTGQTITHISVIRTRLLTKIFQIEKGGTREFDRLLMQI